jgi:hypothetical protein
VVKDAEINRGPRRDREPIDEKALEKIAQKLKSEVIEDGVSKQTHPLNPAQRRIIHKFLQDDLSVKTESIGEDRMKKIENFIKIKKPRKRLFY